MPKVNNIIEGLRIIAKYRKQGLDCYAVQCEHDELYSGPDEGAEMSPEDVGTLQALGWHDDRVNSGCFLAYV